MAVGRSYSGGNVATSPRRAASPPHDVPTTTTRYATVADPGSSSPDFAVDLFCGIESLVAGFVSRELQRLLAAQAEHAKPHEAVIKERVHAVLQILVEIDEHVATEDHVELAERPVRDEVVLRVHDVAHETLVEERAVVLRRVVLGERAHPARPDVVLRVL